MELPTTWLLQMPPLRMSLQSVTLKPQVQNLATNQHQFNLPLAHFLDHLVGIPMIPAKLLELRGLLRRQQCQGLKAPPPPRKLMSIQPRQAEQKKVQLPQD